MSSKIPIYVNINDNPIPPSPVNQANADYFIAKYNNLVDEIEASKKNPFTNALSNLTVYLDSTNGNDSDIERTGQNLSSSFKTTAGLVKFLNRTESYFSNSAVLEIKLNGLFDIGSLDLSEISAAKIVLSSSSSNYNWNLEINGSILRLNHFSVEINGCDLLFREESFFNQPSTLFFNNCNLNFLTNNAVFTVIGGSTIRMVDCLISTNYAITPINIINGTLDLSSSFNEYSSSLSTGYIFNIGTGSTAYLKSAVMAKKTGSVIKDKIIFAENGSKIYYVSETTLEYIPVEFEDQFCLLDRKTSTSLEIAKTLASYLNLLTGNNRIALEAIKGYQATLPITSAEIRDKLVLLSGNERLPASAIKNINYLSYYSSTTSDFVQPAENGTVTVEVGETNWVQASQYVFVSGGGIYEVVAVTDQYSLVLKNHGDVINLKAGETVKFPAKITLSAKPGYRGFTRTSSIFQQPYPKESVFIQFEDDSSFYVGSVIYIDTADYYGVLEIDRTTHICKCVRLGYTFTTDRGVNIAIGSRVVLSGLKGAKGDWPVATLLDDFVVPEIGSDVIIKVDGNDFMNVGSFISIDMAGFFRLEELVDDSHCRIKNTGELINRPANSIVYAPIQVAVVGPRGSSQISRVLEQSIVSETTFGLILDNVDWCYNSQTVRLGEIGYFRIISITQQLNSIIVENINLVPVQTVIPVGTVVAQEGVKGDKGDRGINYSILLEPAFTQSSFSIKLDEVNIFVPDSYIGFGGTSGVALISEIDYENNRILLNNISLPESVTITSQTRVINCGTPNLDTIRLKREFIQPPLDLVVEVNCLQSPINFEIGEYCYIGGGGYYIIVDRNIANKTLSLKNSYHFINRPAGTTIYSTVNKVEGLPSHEVFRLSEAFIQPAGGGIVETSFSNFRYLNVGDFLKSPNNGFYFVRNINTETMDVYLENLGYGYGDEKVAGLEVLEGSLFWKVPPRGESVHVGNYTFLTTPFIVPNYNEEVIINVVDSDWLIVGMYIAIETAGSSFLITQLISNSQIKIKNLVNSKISGTEIRDGAKISTGTYAEDYRISLHRRNIQTSIYLALV